jgi:hypothetical protein
MAKRARVDALAARRRGFDLHALERRARFSRVGRGLMEHRTIRSKAFERPRACQYHHQTQIRCGRLGRLHPPTPRAGTDRHGLQHRTPATADPPHLVALPEKPSGGAGERPRAPAQARCRKTIRYAQKAGSRCRWRRGPDRDDRLLELVELAERRPDCPHRETPNRGVKAPCAPMQKRHTKLI